VATVLAGAGCALWDKVMPGPEFAVSGARVVVMPFKGPGDLWYGDHKSANEMYPRACSMLANDGGAIIVRADDVMRKVMSFGEEGTPPWTAYGQQLRADYVIVAELFIWEIEQRKTVGYYPGRAAMDIKVLSVASDDLVFQKIVDVEVGYSDDALEIHTEAEQTRRALISQLLREWRKVFVKK